MIVQYSITGAAWTAITSAGESGACWLDEQADGAGGKVDVRIFHSSTGEPDSDDVTKGKRIYTPNNNSDVCLISADSDDDIYYAICGNENDTATLSVDVS